MVSVTWQVLIVAVPALVASIFVQAVEKCQLKETISKLPSLLDSSGKLVEYDEPSKLMDSNSSFSKLVAEYWSSCGKNSFTNFSSQQQ
ncbi:hypothetical protein TSUD_356430 [Trifolium subterraneum]|uniref:ABC transmembrane type-1 domain-containing protein n=1 Tax=Trifolium subterraneum TaxID=3900 RepID=A0A2Z6NDD8_TRISU|nr:hypothetical protein TSUD_356430 [Trifolium subterraneum]